MILHYVRYDAMHQHPVKKSTLILIRTWFPILFPDPTKKYWGEYPVPFHSTHDLNHVSAFFYFYPCLSCLGLAWLTLVSPLLHTGCWLLTYQQYDNYPKIENLPKPNRKSESGGTSQEKKRPAIRDVCHCQCHFILHTHTTWYFILPIISLLILILHLRSIDHWF